MQKIKIGTGQMISKGHRICIISIGHIGNMIMEICAELKELKIGHCDIRFLKPLDEQLLHNILKNYDIIISVEDGCIKGGLGSALIEFSSDNNYKNKIIRFGVPDVFIEHGTPEEQRKECGYDKNTIIQKIKELS